MCTAISFKTGNHYFGRNLDLEYHYNEQVVVMPRNVPFQPRFLPPVSRHYAMIGMATLDDQYPLFYDATNEYGLSIAALNFPGNEVYQPYADNMLNVAPFELIPWLLGCCKTVTDAQRLLVSVNVINNQYNEKYQLTPLHWIIADATQSITVEPLHDGLHVYKNPMGVLTNNPPFEYHLQNINHYMGLSRNTPLNRFSDTLELKATSNGMGGIGLPGDLSSASRFIRGTFTKLNSRCEPDDISSITQFFHILSAVEQPSGCVLVGESFEKTIYSSCCNTDTLTYYYTTYDNRQITGIAMRNVDLNQGKLIAFPLNLKQNIYMCN